MFNRPQARKHVNDYYRIVLQHRMDEIEKGSRSIWEWPRTYTVQPKHDTASLLQPTDMDPDSGRMGFLIRCHFCRSPPIIQKPTHGEVLRNA